MSACKSCATGYEPEEILAASFAGPDRTHAKSRRVGVPSSFAVLLNEGDGDGSAAIVELAHRLGLSNAQVTASEAVDMRCGNAATIGLVVIDLEASGIVTVILEQSNDLENWQATVATAIQSAGYSSIRARGIGSRFVRLRYSASGAAGTVAVLAALVKAWKR